MRTAFFLAALAVTTAFLRAQPGPAPGQSVPQRPGLGAPAGGPKVCVVEMKATTKVVHGSVCKDYCQPRILPDCVRRGLGLPCGDCGNLRTFRVLTKKVVPGPDVPVCRVKDLSEPAPSMSAGTGAKTGPGADAGKSP